MPTRSAAERDMSTSMTAPTSPKTAARGYGGRHQALRKRWAQIIAEGGAACARCGGAIVPPMLWDLGHVDHDRSRYVGPEHRACNRATAGRHSRRRPVPPSRDWSGMLGNRAKDMCQYQIDM